MGYMVILGFTGVGKSRFVANNNMVSDVDSSNFTLHKDFPENYITFLEDNLEKKTATFMSTHKEVRDALHEKNIPYVLIYPSLDQKDDYLERYRLRGCEMRYISKVEANFEKWIKELMADKRGHHIQLAKGQTLSDVVTFDKDSKCFELLKTLKGK